MKKENIIGYVQAPSIAVKKPQTKVYRTVEPKRFVMNPDGTVSLKEDYVGWDSDKPNRTGE
jgi:hypothetical protein